MTTKSPANPHCAQQWPYNIAHSHRAARLAEAAYAASTIAGLLIADAGIASNRADSDTPDDEPVPFSENTKHGLFAALNVCLSEINGLADYFQDCDIRKLEAGA